MVEALNKYSILVGGTFRHRNNSPVTHEIIAVKNPDDGVGITNVNYQQHM